MNIPNRTSFGIILYITLIGVITLNLCNLCYSQEIQFSQYNAFPLYLNPASTGQISQNRISLVSRSQWVNIDGAYNTLGFSYDYNLKRMKSGLGLVVLQDESSGGGFSTFTAGGLYAYHLRINRKLFLNSGMRVAYIQQRLDPTKLTFADQLIRNDGSPTYEVFDNLMHDFVDFSWGNIFFYYDSVKASSYWIGIALDHLNTPEISFKDYPGVLPVKYTIHGGGKYLLNKDVRGYPISVISFSFLYKGQLKWDQAELGASYIYRFSERKKSTEREKRGKPSFKKPEVFPSLSETQMPWAYLEAGLAYRGIPFLKRNKAGYLNHDALIILFGFSCNDIKIAYTFDVTISKLSISNTAGAHEISLIYKFIIPHSETGLTKSKKMGDSMF
ncbi:MAG: PorP/SprF family type IX secretion system membrane protein [Bacteroidota bacterium]